MKGPGTTRTSCRGMKKYIYISTKNRNFVSQLEFTVNQIFGCTIPTLGTFFEKFNEDCPYPTTPEHLNMSKKLEYSHLSCAVFL